MRELFCALGLTACSLASQQAPVPDYVPPSLEAATTPAEVLASFKRAVVACSPEIPLARDLRRRLSSCGTDYLGEDHNLLEHARFWVYVSNEALGEYCRISPFYMDCRSSQADCTHILEPLLNAERTVRTWSGPLFEGFCPE